MRQTISGLVAAIAVVTASAAPAMACGGGLFQSSCSPADRPMSARARSPGLRSPAPAYSYSGCNTGCGGWAHERLPDPVQQYYYVNQGPTYTGPGNFAPYPTYQERSIIGPDLLPVPATSRPIRPIRKARCPAGTAIATALLRLSPSRHTRAAHGRRRPMRHHAGYGYREHVLRRYY